MRKVSRKPDRDATGSYAGWTRRRFALNQRSNPPAVGEMSMNQAGPYCRVGVLLAGLALALPAGRADAAWSDVLQEGVAAAQAAQQTFLEEAERAIVVGGVLLYRHRHAVAGAAIGCVAGLMAATTTAIGAGLATGGAALAGTGPAAALGCGLGALGGAALGHPLDNVYDEP
jgi:hypothetical protein